MNANTLPPPPPPSPPTSAKKPTAYLRSLPKAELHLHLEGTITPSTLATLSLRHNSNPITLAQAQALYAYSSFSHFLSVWDLVCQRLRSPGDYATIASEMCTALAAQGTRHAEVFVAVGSLVEERPWLDVGAVFAALEAVRIDAEARHGLSVLWIVDASRQRGLAHVEKIFSIAARLRERFPAVVGVGIGGDEAAGPCIGLREAFVKAREAGLRLTAHCGEATGRVAGPREIWDALAIGVERIGHGFCAQYDEELIGELKRRGTALELNVTSNVRTGVCRSVEEHPIKKYVEAGLVCTINSDDPAMFGSDLLQEYTLVCERIGLSLKEMKALAANSFRYSFLDDARKSVLINLVEQYESDWST